jgi:hypothetical protein
MPPGLSAICGEKRWEFALLTKGGSLPDANVLLPLASRCGPRQGIGFPYASGDPQLMQNGKWLELSDRRLGLARLRTICHTGVGAA